MVGLRPETVPEDRCGGFFLVPFGLARPRRGGPPVIGFASWPSTELPLLRVGYLFSRSERQRQLHSGRSVIDGVSRRDSHISEPVAGVVFVD